MGWHTAEFVIQQHYLLLKKKRKKKVFSGFVLWGKWVHYSHSVWFSLGTEHRSRQEPCHYVGCKDEQYWTQWKYMLRVTFGYSNGGMQHFYCCLLQRHKTLQIWVGFFSILIIRLDFRILLKSELSVDRTLESNGLACYKLEEMLQTLLRYVPLQHFGIGKHRKKKGS